MNRYKCEKKNFFLRKKFFRGGPAHPVKKKFFRPSAGKIFFGYTWIHLDTPGNCQVLPDTPERPEKCPRVWFLGPGVSRSFQVGGNCEKKISGGAGYPWHNPTCTYAFRPSMTLSAVTVQFCLKM